MSVSIAMAALSFGLSVLSFSTGEPFLIALFVTLFVCWCLAALYDFKRSR